MRIKFIEIETLGVEDEINEYLLHGWKLREFITVQGHMVAVLEI